MAIFVCINYYGFAIIIMDNVWQYVTQLFGTLCLINHSTWPTVHINWFFSFPYGLGISSKMTKCAISTFVPKYSFYRILYPYSVRHNIRTVQDCSTYLHEILARIKAAHKPCFRCTPTDRKRKHACTDSQRKISFKRQDSCHFIPIFSRTLKIAFDNNCFKFCCSCFCFVFCFFLASVSVRTTVIKYMGPESRILSSIFLFFNENDWFPKQLIYTPFQRNV